jgi:hypothetical protein
VGTDAEAPLRPRGRRRGGKRSRRPTPTSTISVLDTTTSGPSRRPTAGGRCRRAGGVGLRAMRAGRVGRARRERSERGGGGGRGDNGGGCRRKS